MVNGNLVHTAVVPQLQLVASRVSRTGFYFCVRGFGHPSTVRFQAGADMFMVRLTCQHLVSVEMRKLKTGSWVGFSCASSLGLQNSLLSVKRLVGAGGSWGTPS